MKENIFKNKTLWLLILFIIVLTIGGTKLVILLLDSSENSSEQDNTTTTIEQKVNDNDEFGDVVGEWILQNGSYLYTNENDHDYYILKYYETGRVKIDSEGNITLVVEYVGEYGEKTKEADLETGEISYGGDYIMSNFVLEKTYIGKVTKNDDSSEKYNIVFTESKDKEVNCYNDLEEHLEYNNITTNETYNMVLGSFLEELKIYSSGNFSFYYLR